MTKAVAEGAAGVARRASHRSSKDGSLKKTPVSSALSLWPRLSGCSTRAYGLAMHEIAAAVERMLQTDVLVIENEQEVFTAMIALKEGHGSFADALIVALGARVGCSF
jgi:predicted nucleic acid-binding protein